MLGHGIENESRGESIRLLIALIENNTLNPSSQTLEVLKLYNDPRKDNKQCSLCRGTFNNIKKFANAAQKNLRELEYTTFLVGIELPLEAAEQEDEFKARYNVTHGESMRSQFSRDIGKLLCKMTGKQVDFGKPEVVVLVEPFTKIIRLKINPFYISGRYQKLVRGIPQSRWLCGDCLGKGCEICNWSGRMYQESIEELIGIPILKITQGQEISFHGAGREDVDARMLGSGRPFVMEIKEPKKRFVDLHKLEKKINKCARGKVKVTKLRVANKDVVRKYKKAEGAEKIYRAIVEFGRNVSTDELKQVESTLSNTIISQQTPNRVLHRRANLTRERYIYQAKTRRMSQNRAEIRIHCQGGLYIKELINGDEGRTKISVASILGVEASTLELDVLSVVIGDLK
jgi:tRNA pseudouridine synthase 10